MGEFGRAPDNQPTSNIELQLRRAQDDEREWRVAVNHHTERLKSSDIMQKYSAERVAELEWQLEQRKATEVNGL